MSDDELAQAAALHAGKRRWTIIVLGNLLLLIAMVGVPWLRGFLRTRELWQRFGEYGACLTGGQVADSPGLGMPSGHEAHFATRALANSGFAAACDAQLSALAPRPAIFLLPSLKTAENDLRAAVKLVRDELAPLPARAPGSRLTTRPLRAIERLRAGLANHTNATGAVEVPERVAFTLPESAHVLPTPTRLPLYAGANALVSLWGEGGALHALATDQTGVSYVRVHRGQLEQTRVTRPKLFEAALPREQPSSWVWAMSRARCLERAQGCSDKTLGVARASFPLSTFPSPRWLGGHPGGRLDRSVQRLDDRIWLAAQTGDGGSEVREFTLEPAGEESASAETPPLAPSRTWAARVGKDPKATAPAPEPLLLRAEDGVRGFVASTGARKQCDASGASCQSQPAEHHALLQVLTPEGVTPLTDLPGEGKAWVVGCTEAGASGLAFGHGRALVIASARADGTLVRWEPLPFELGEVLHERDLARDRVQRLCGLGDRAFALVHDQKARLWLVACRVGEPACRVESIAREVTSFAAITTEARLIAAYAGEGEASQVRVRSADLARLTLSDELVPSVCWSDAKGLCGSPVLARVAERVVLATREGTDMRVLDSQDHGLTFRPLPDLKKSP